MGLLLHAIHWITLTMAFFLSLEHTSSFLPQDFSLAVPSACNSLFSDHQVSGSFSWPTSLFQVPLHITPTSITYCLIYRVLFSSYSYHNLEFLFLFEFIVFPPQFQYKVPDGRALLSLLIQCLKNVPGIKHICEMNEVSLS